LTPDLGLYVLLQYFVKVKVESFKTIAIDFNSIDYKLLYLSLHGILY